MKFYHRTTEENWAKIQEEGVLWGIPHTYPEGEGEVRRYTYLSPDDWGGAFGTILLEVEYEPHGVGMKNEMGDPYDNYGFNPPEGMECWQFSVFNPISISDVHLVNPDQ